MAAEYWFDPQRWFTFVEAEGFSDDWKHLGFNDDDLQTLQSKRPAIAILD